MSLRRFVVFMGVSACLAGAFAQDERERVIPAERVMGIYQGAITGLDSASLEIHLPAISDTAFRAVLMLKDGNGNTSRGAVEARTDGLVVKVDGSTTLDGPFAGSCHVKGSIERGKFTGALEVSGKSASFELKKAKVESPTYNAPAPANARVLFDGKNQEQWVAVPEGWGLTGNDAMEVSEPSLMTREELGSGTYHIEFRTPFMPYESGQARGNSGVYLLGRYEVQVLDSFGDLPADNLCGGIYKKAVPKTMACLPPLDWQTYDIEFTAAKFDASGKKSDDAVITVKHNGVLIHDRVKLSGCTPGGVSGDDAPTGPLLLQNHGDRVQYRNIWFAPAP